MFSKEIEVSKTLDFSKVLVISSKLCKEKNSLLKSSQKKVWSWSMNLLIQYTRDSVCDNSAGRYFGRACSFLMLKPITYPCLSRNFIDTFCTTHHVVMCMHASTVWVFRRKLLLSLRAGSHQPADGICPCPLHKNLVIWVWVICFRLTCLAAQPSLELKIHSLQVQKLWIPALLCALCTYA